MARQDDPHSGSIVKPTPDPTVLTREAAENAKSAADKVDELRDQSLQRELTLRHEQRETEINALNDSMHRSSKGDRRYFKSEMRVTREQLKADHRILKLMEAHRLELKTDSEKQLTTASIAAEKAVQAALAAAEKARDQQTIASQLATSKAEDNSKEQLKQQGEQFSTAIASLSTGLNDVKSLLGELRAEKRGNQENKTDSRAGNTLVLAVIGTVLTVAIAASAIIPLLLGK
jgi:phosphate/sulfate permease